MKKRGLFCLIIGIMLSLPFSIQAVDSVTVSIANYGLFYRTPTSVNGKMEYPFLCYNDKAYMAVSDVAKMLGRNAVYQEELQSQRIYLNRTLTVYENEALIESKEMALNIGKTIIEKYYAEELNDTSLYYVRYQSPHWGKQDNFFDVKVTFNPPDIETMRESLGYNDNKHTKGDSEVLAAYLALRYDIEVKIDPIDGAIFEISDISENKWKEISTTELREKLAQTENSSDDEIEYESDHLISQ